MTGNARDPLLRAFVEANDAAADVELAALVETRALPLARIIVARKLGSFGSGGRSCEAQDRDDVVGEAMATLIERLRAERAGTGQTPIQNFASYVAAVVLSACAHHIRRRYPQRAALKNRLRYVFSSARSLALWTTHEDETACGLAEWRGRPIDDAARGRLRRVLEQDDGSWTRLSPADLERRAADLLSSTGGPVPLEALVEAIVPVSGLVEPVQAGDVAVLPSTEPAHDVVFEHRRMFARVWQEVIALPLGQRQALLLNLRGTDGAGLLWLLPVAGVATVRQIADVLEIPTSDFAALWRHLPLDDAAIAERMGCARQQVINLRMAARKRLGNRLQTVLPEMAARRSRAANLSWVSASLKTRA